MEKYNARGNRFRGGEAESWGDSKKNRNYGLHTRFNNSNEEKTKLIEDFLNIKELKSLDIENINLK